MGLGLLFLRLGWSVHGSKKAHVIWPKVSTSNISLWLRSWGVIVIINTINYNIFKHKSRFCDQGQHQITFLSQQRTNSARDLLPNTHSTSYPPNSTQWPYHIHKLLTFIYLDAIHNHSYPNPFLTYRIETAQLCLHAYDDLPPYMTLPYFQHAKSIMWGPFPCITQALILTQNPCFIDNPCLLEPSTHRIALSTQHKTYTTTTITYIGKQSYAYEYLANDESLNTMDVEWFISHLVLIYTHIYAHTHIYTHAHTHTNKHAYFL